MGWEHSLYAAVNLITSNFIKIVIKVLFCFILNYFERSTVSLKTNVGPDHPKL